MNVEIKKNHQCLKLIEELNELIKDAIGLFDNFSNSKVSGNNVQKMEDYETIIFDYLLEKTNFTSVIDFIKVGCENVNNSCIIIPKILATIGQKELAPTFNNFLNILNDRISELKALPLQKYTYYIPTKIGYLLTDTDLNKLKIFLKKSINISLCNIPKKIINKINSNNYKILLRNRKLIICFEKMARDYIYPLKYLNKEIHAFAGILAFSNCSHKYFMKFAVASNDMSIIESPLEGNYLIIVKDNNEIIYPNSSRWSILDRDCKKDISLIGKKTLDINNTSTGNYKKLKTLLNSLKNQKNSIQELSKESFAVYFEACTDMQLEISFLKFWIIIEKILKQGERIKDDYIIRFLKKLIKEKHLKKLIDGLHNKRNDLVHEFNVSTISQQDRNLTKEISETIIQLLIDPPAKIKTGQDLRMLIDNLFSSKNELKKIITILNKLIKSSS